MLVTRGGCLYSERFRVIIVLPCHPEGDHHTNRSVQSVLHNMFATICRGETSLFGTLKSMYPDVVPSECVGGGGVSVQQCECLETNFSRQVHIVLLSSNGGFAAVRGSCDRAGLCAYFTRRAYRYRVCPT